MNSSCLSFAILYVIAISASVTASALHENAYTLDTTARVANFRDVNHLFRSGYKSSSLCPTEVNILGFPTIERNIGRVRVSDIREDGNTCSATGDGTFKIVSEATVKQGDLIRKLGFPKAFAGLTSNIAAKATIGNHKADSSLLVGFDEGVRTCGNNVYPDNTFWFFIREASAFKILIRKDQGIVNVTIPSNTRALFLASNTRLCVLYDTSTSFGQNLTVSRKSNAGNGFVEVPIKDPNTSSPLVTPPEVAPLPSSEPVYNPSVSLSDSGTGDCLPKLLRYIFPYFSC